MKFTSAVLLLFIAVGVAEVDGMSIRGNTKRANKLMTFARRLEDAGNGNANNNGGYNNGYNNGGNNYNGQAAANNGYGGYYGEMEEEAMYFLNNYSIKLLSCIQGEQVINYENGEMESSTVIFRLCPSDSCDADSALGCESGYGDFAVGISTFLEAYIEQQQDDQYYGNGMIVYNQYGQEFDAQEYMECKEYNVEEDQNQNQQQQYNNYNNGNYNNGQNNNGQNNNNNNGRNLQNNNYQNYNNGYYQNAQFFVGPSCSADGTTISLGMYMDEACSYPAQVSFADIAYGWDSGLPFSDGGLVSMNCVACYGPNENYEYELSELCTESYQSSTSRCEVNMESNSYYGQNTQGCNYVNGLVESVYGSATNETDMYDSNSTSSSSGWGTTVNEVSTRFMDTLNTREARAFIAAMVLFCLSAFFGALLITCFCVKKRKERKRRRKAAAKGEQFLPEAESVVKRRSSVVALVRSGTNSIRESVKTAATGAKMVVATAAAKSVASVKKTDGDAETVKTLDYKDMEDPSSGTASVKSHKSIKSRMSSMAAKTVASVKSISSKKKVDDAASTKSDYIAPEPIISAPATASVKSTKSSTKSVKSEAAASVKSSASKGSNPAPAMAVVAAVGAAAVVAAPLITKEDASTKSGTASVKSTTPTPEPVDASDDAPVDTLETAPAPTTTTTEYKPDVLDYIFGGCAGAEAVDKVVADDSSITPDSPETVSPSEPIPAATEPVATDSTPEPTPAEPDVKTASTIEPVVETVSEPATEHEVAATEPENETKIEPPVEEKAEAAEEEKEASAAPAVVEETQAEDAVEEATPALEEKSMKSSETTSTLNSVKTEKTKGGKRGSFLSKIDSHLKKKLSKKSMKEV